MFIGSNCKCATWCNHSKYENKTQEKSKIRKVAKKNVFATFLIQKFKSFFIKMWEVAQMSLHLHLPFNIVKNLLQTTLNYPKILYFIF